MRRLKEAVAEFGALVERRQKQMLRWTQDAIAVRRALLLNKPSPPRLWYHRPVHVARVVALDDRYRVMLC